MTDSHESNKADLETFLDTSTTLFLRAVHDRHNLYGINGTALGVVSLGSGVPPSGEGAYRGYFTFIGRKNRALVINTNGPYFFAGTTFINRMKNGRGHEINYVQLPRDFKPSWAMDSRERENFVKGFLGSSEDVPIVGKVRNYLFGFVKWIKGAEFKTLEHYTLQGQKDGTPQKEISRIKGVFGRAINRALVSFNEPIVPIYVNRNFGDYRVSNLTSRILMAERSDRSEEDGSLPEKIMLPVSKLDKDGLQDIRTWENGAPLNAGFILKRDGDVFDKKDWELVDVYTPRRMFGKKVYFDKPEMLRRGERRYIK